MSELSCGLTISVRASSGRAYSSWRARWHRRRWRGRHCQCLCSWKFLYISLCQPLVQPSSPPARDNRRHCVIWNDEHSIQYTTNTQFFFSAYRFTSRNKRNLWICTMKWLKLIRENKKEQKHSPQLDGKCICRMQDAFSLPYHKHSHNCITYTIH